MCAMFPSCKTLHWQPLISEGVCLAPLNGCSAIPHAGDRRFGTRYSCSTAQWAVRLNTARRLSGDCSQQSFKCSNRRKLFTLPDRTWAREGWKLPFQRPANGYALGTYFQAQLCLQMMALDRNHETAFQKPGGSDAPCWVPTANQRQHILPRSWL